MLTFVNVRKKITLQLILLLSGVVIISKELFISDAYAYLDPGSGSIIIQAIIGAFVGVGITLKIYWYKLKEKLRRR